MSDPLIDPSDLATFLNVPTEGFNAERAAMLIGLAQSLCESIVSPLPASAAAVVLDVAQRAYTNPSNLQQHTVGPFSETTGPTSGGLWLTRQNISTLRRLNGGGGAFTIDTTPASALVTPLGWWDVSNVADGCWQ